MCVCFGEQDMQNSLDRESSSLKDLESQKQIAQERLEEMDQQRSKLEGMLNDVKQKCQEESQMVRERERDTFLLENYLRLHSKRLVVSPVHSQIVGHKGFIVVPRSLNLDVLWVAKSLHFTNVLSYSFKKN